jgi:hypothetical protein
MFLSRVLVIFLKKIDKWLHKHYFLLENSTLLSQKFLESPGMLTYNFSQWLPCNLLADLSWIYIYRKYFYEFSGSVNIIKRVKTNKYTLINCPNLGISNLLCIPTKSVSIYFLSTICELCHFSPVIIFGNNLPHLLYVTVRH